MGPVAASAPRHRPWPGLARHKSRYAGRRLLVAPCSRSRVGSRRPRAQAYVPWDADERNHPRSSGHWSRPLRPGARRTARGTACPVKPSAAYGSVTKASHQPRAPPPSGLAPPRRSRHHGGPTATVQTPCPPIAAWCAGSQRARVRRARREVPEIPRTRVPRRGRRRPVRPFPHHHRARQRKCMRGSGRT